MTVLINQSGSFIVKLITKLIAKNRRSNSQYKSATTKDKIGTIWNSELFNNRNEF